MKKPRKKKTDMQENSQRSPENLIWIDLEMTGLDTQHDTIIEIATIVTDKHLNILAEGPEIAIKKDKRVMDAMDAWCTNQHGRSGLTERVLKSDISTAMAEQETLSFLSRFVGKGESPICGNSICQDRRFLAREMPELEAYFHYRNLDVSTLKELVKRWRPELSSGFSKKSSHLAMDDIKDSIEELKYYRANFFVLE